MKKQGRNKETVNKRINKDYTKKQRNEEKQSKQIINEATDGLIMSINEVQK